MGDEVDPDELTRSAGVADEETQSVQAWGVAEEYDEPARRQVSARIITTVAIVTAVIALVGAAILVGYQLRGDPPAAAPVPSPTATMIKATVAAAPSAMPPNVTMAPPSTVTVRVPAPAPPPRSRVALGTYTTFVSWTGTSCIQIRYPAEYATPVEMTCAAGQVQTLHHTVSSPDSPIVGADPIMGDATAIACKVVSDATGAVLASDSGYAGDGHDVNCIVGAS